MDMGLVVEERSIVVPGEVLAEGLDYLPGEGTWRDGERIKARQLGLLDVKGRQIRVIPLAGKYLPRKGDLIIGRVTNINLHGWQVDINSPYPAMLPLANATSTFIPRGADLSRFFNIGDYIVTKVVNVSSQNIVDLTMKGPGLRKLQGGRIFMVTPAKVPRIIGHNGSMIRLIKQATNARIIIGQNGVCHIQAEPEEEILAIRAIRIVETYSHVQGLTDAVKRYLEEKTGREIMLEQTTPSPQDE